jgi:hypothetical protein
MKRLAVSVSCIVAAAIVAMHAASASFSGGTAVNESSATIAGDLYLSAPSYPGTPSGGPTAFTANRMQLTVNDLGPGVARERVIDISVAGNVDLASMKVNVSASDTSSLLLTQANALGIVIDRCSTEWTEAGSSPDYTYTCSGSQNEIIGDGSTSPPGTTVAPTTNGTAKDHDLSSGVTLTAGAVNHLRVVFALPTAAPSNLQGVSVVLTFTFSGTQRAGTSK